MHPFPRPPAPGVPYTPYHPPTYAPNHTQGGAFGLRPPYGQPYPAPNPHPIPNPYPNPGHNHYPYPHTNSYPNPNPSPFTRPSTYSSPYGLPQQQPPHGYVCPSCNGCGHWASRCPTITHPRAHSFPQPHYNPSPPPPPSMTEYCEPCDKEFPSKERYLAHCKSHDKCNSCSFEGSKKVVIAHFHAVHGKFKGSGYKIITVEGQRFRVLVGTSPVEVSEWRADRRKRFPTAANIQAKRRTVAALDEAGALFDKESHRNKRQKTFHDTKSNPAPNPLACASASETATPGLSVVEPKPIVQTNILGSLIAYESSEEEVEPNSTLNQETKLVLAPCEDATLEKRAALESWVGGEGDVAGGGVVQEPKRVQPSRRPCSFHMQGKCLKGDACDFSHDAEPIVCRFFSQGYCRKGRRCTFKHDRDQQAKAKTAQMESSSKLGENSKKRGLVLPKPVNGSQLLYKLLQDQVKTDDSILLQSIRYIIRRGFLQTPLAPSELQSLEQSERMDADTLNPNAMSIPNLIPKSNEIQAQALRQVLEAESISDAVLDTVCPELAGVLKYIESDDEDQSEEEMEDGQV